MSWLVAASLYRWVTGESLIVLQEGAEVHETLLGTVFHIPQNWISLGHQQLRILALSVCWTPLWEQSSKRTLNPGKLSCSVFHFCSMSVSVLNI